MEKIPGTRKNPTKAFDFYGKVRSRAVGGAHLTLAIFNTMMKNGASPCIMTNRYSNC